MNSPRLGVNKGRRAVSICHKDNETFAKQACATSQFLIRRIFNKKKIVYFVV